MDDFKYKTYRCEWQLRFITVDQYGQTMKVTRKIAYPSLKAARDDLDFYAVENEWVKGRFHPKGDNNEYHQVDIGYEEVPVEVNEYELKS